MMKNGCPAFLVLLLLTVFSLPAFAAGPYVGVEGGGAFLQKSKITGEGTSDVDLKTKTGYGVGAVGGYDFGTYRLEGEFAYRRNDNKDVTGGLSGNVGGDFSNMALLVNGFYDFKMVSPVVYPYVGAGIGGARASLKVTDDAGVTQVDNNKTVFAYQLAAGVAYNVMKELTLDLGYKFFATAKPEFEVTGGGKAKAEYMSHDIFLTARYNF